MFKNTYEKIQEQFKSANEQINLAVTKEDNKADIIQYVYHRKPSELIGNSIIPLNKMPGLSNFESVYKSAKAKYNGREITMEMTWPALGNCKWNDVIFLSPIHPNCIYQQFQQIGISTNDTNLDYFYKIPVTLLNLDPSKTITWTFPSASNDPSIAFPLDSFHPIDPTTYKELDELPEKTKQYYKEEFLKTGKRPLAFFYVPHVITTDPIEITKDISVVNWKDPRI